MTETNQKSNITVIPKHESWVYVGDKWVAWVWKADKQPEWYITPIWYQPEEFKAAINASRIHDTEQAAVEFTVQTAEKFYSESESEIETETNE